MISKDNSLQLSIEEKNNVGSPGDGRQHTIHLLPKHHAYKHPKCPSDLSWPKVTRRQSSDREITVQDQPVIVVSKALKHSPRGRLSEALGDETRAWRKAHGSIRRSLTPYPYQRQQSCSDTRFHRTVSEEWTLDYDSKAIFDTVPADNMPPLWHALEPETNNAKIVPKSDELTVPGGDKDEDLAASHEKCHKGVQTQAEEWASVWDLSLLPNSRCLRKVESESSLHQLAIRCWEEQPGSSAREKDSEDRRTDTPSSVSRRKLCTRHKRSFNQQDSEQYVLGTDFVMSVAVIAISAILVAIAMLDIILMMHNWIFPPEEEESFEFIPWLYYCVRIMFWVNADIEEL